MSKNISIIGGGTAGWITALLVKEYYPSFNISLIESDEIGILGAGEGTTPQFVKFLDEVGIPFSDIVKNCKATLKQGIEFTNWLGDNTSYFHAFDSNDDLSEFKGIIATDCIAEGKSLDTLSLPSKLCKENKACFSKNKIYTAPNPILEFDVHAEWAVHFDARLLAAYLQEISVSRGIVRIEGKVIRFDNISNGDINNIVLDNGSEIKTDFIFDCTGFARLIIGKHFNSKWISYKDFLPLDSAIPFFIDHSGNTSPQTEAIAMNAGWIWKIPVRDRYGCGYVFNSEYISAEDALKEAEEYFGQKLNSPKVFNFSPGSYEDTLINNCMAIGLSQSFVEPLEATSIWASYTNLSDFIAADGFYITSNTFKKKFNRRCLDRNNQIAEFLNLHYTTPRNDTPFWKDLPNKIKQHPGVQEVLDLLNENQWAHIDRDMFLNQSWIQVANGLKLIDKKCYDSIMKRYNIDELDDVIDDLISKQTTVLNKSILHQKFLEYLEKQ